MQSQTTFAKTDQPTYTTTYSYTAGGALASISVADGRPRTITFTTDMLGQVIRRDESGGNSAGDPHEVWHRYNGRQLGYTGNNGTLDTDYPGSIVNRMRITPRLCRPRREKLLYRSELEIAALSYIAPSDMGAVTIPGGGISLPNPQWVP